MDKMSAVHILLREWSNIYWKVRSLIHSKETSTFTSCLWPTSTELGLVIPVSIWLEVTYLDVGKLHIIFSKLKYTVWKISWL